ncbi:MAG: histidine kinase [Bacteroidetes bacterium]|nr:MAG: histidine kinase [Bacteroidota bacterium]
MRPEVILLTALAYLGLLFGIAYLTERHKRLGKYLVRNPYAYALSLGVFCTAWTFYGSVGRAAETGIGFLPVYLGPSLMAPLWYVVLRKMIVIARSQRITSIADFISARYGKSPLLGGVVALISILGIIPYISLQLKAVSFSYEILTKQDSALQSWLSGDNFYQDTAFYTALILAAFTILFGTRHLEASERHEGLIAAVAFESIVKLVAFLAVGLFVTFWVYDGPAALFAEAAAIPDIAAKFRLSTPEMIDPWGWTWIMLISLLAVFLLPRQFHVMVVENTHHRHVNKAVWLFPLYLFLINLFVLPIALGGLMSFAGGNLDADTFVLTFPQRYGQDLLALLVFIGGLSASSSMVIVATISLSIMASNDLLVPILLRTAAFRRRLAPDLSQRLIGIRRLIIIVILMLAYVYFISIGRDRSLVSIGLISFTAVAQFAPALIGGLFWRGGTRVGATVGMLVGFAIWCYTLPLPSLAQSGYLPLSLVTEGPWGLAWLRPFALFGLEGMSEIAHAAFWSLFLNTACYVGISLYHRPSLLEQTQAHLFVHIDRYEADATETPSWQGKAFLHDIRMLLDRFLGQERSAELLEAFARVRKLDLQQAREAPRELVTYAEKLLAGAVGSASARLLIASAVKEEPVGLTEVMEVLDETRELIHYSQELEAKSRELELTGQQLRQANERLQHMSRIKDDFIATVTHELRTPITSIRAIAGILHDNQDLPEDKRQEFLSVVVRESARISRLINQVLDLEKMESGVVMLEKKPVDLIAVIQEVAQTLAQVCKERRAQLQLDLPEKVSPFMGDRDRLQQVVLNLLSNAVKFCDDEAGRVQVHLVEAEGQLVLSVTDNGPGLSAEEQLFVFDKFTQFNDHRRGRPQGTGLGLSISWRIVHLHHGRLEVESPPGAGATFTIRLPLREGAVPPMQPPQRQVGQAPGP